VTRLINIDNGGTLTDVCVIDDDGVRCTKILTTPFDLSRCLFDGLAKASVLLYDEPRPAALLQATDRIRYSTTQGTNALVQRDGPRLGLLTTDTTLIEGLAATVEEEDLLGALVGDRHAVIDVSEDDQALAERLVRCVNTLVAGGTDRLVVSIGGPDGADQEKRVKRLLSGTVPPLFSWELVADRDDVRRTWSALLDAFLRPAVERFLVTTERRMRDQHARHPLLIFRNDGGSSRVARSSAIKTCNSGPRGGLEGTRALARQYGFRHVVMADVGGTTTDIGVVTHGALEVDPRGRMANVVTSFELAGITSHGVGGNSVIRVRDGQLTVGPDSVGATPGPACFGRGGTEATITDVYLLMGVLDPGTYLDGSLTLDAGAGRRAVEETVAGPLGSTLDEALVRMEEAYLERVAAALRGARPTRDTVVAAIGGAGPMTMCGAARLAGVRRVVVPRTAAVFSAVGIGYSDISQRYERPLDDRAAIDGIVSELRGLAARDMSAEGVDPARCVQTWRLRIESDGREEFADLVSPADAAKWPADGPVSLELTVVAPLPHVPPAPAGPVAPSLAVPAGIRAVRGPDGGRLDLPLIDLVAQRPGAQVDGPAVIEGPFFTMRLPTGWQGETSAAGDLLLTDRRSS
jgi:N-methylhydantoinase A/oxoprolinase/acetone carboxylase beta subunit